MSPHQWLAGAICAAMLAGCVIHPTTIESRYGPLHPANGASVDFRIKAHDADGIDVARLYVYEYELYVNNRMQSARQRSGGQWGLARTWTFPAGPADIDVTHTATGFPAGSFITYISEVSDKRGSVTRESWSFAAGDWPFGNSPIPLWGNGAPANRIDVAFVADRDDYATARGMLPALATLIFDGYHTNNMVKFGRRMWQFYYSPERGTISDYDSGTFVLDIPDSVENSTIIDHAAVIHTTVKRDWASGGNFGTEPGNRGTAVHESGHAAFGLADEYNGGGHFTSSDPYHNNYSSRASCETYVTGRGWPTTDCQNVQGSWYRPEPATAACIMLDDQDANMPDFGRSCRLRAIWYYLQLGS